MGHKSQDSKMFSTSSFYGALLLALAAHQVCAASVSFISQAKVDGPVLVSHDDEEVGPFPERDIKGEDSMNAVATVEIKKRSAVDIMNDASPEVNFDNSQLREQPPVVFNIQRVNQPRRDFQRS